MKDDTSLHQKSSFETFSDSTYARYTWLRAIGYTILFTLGGLLITAVALGSFAYSKFQVFLREAQLTPQELRSIVEQGLQSTPIQTNGYKHMLILGTDEVENRSGEPVLTDTLLLASLDTNTGTIRTLSLPRDLWSPEYQTKINALYSYGDQRYPGSPELFTTEVLREMTELPIHHTIVLRLDDVASLIDLLGGIEVDVPVAFVDEQFPRSDVDISSGDPSELYTTVSFEQGPQHFTGEQALSYIRSRHSGDEQGTDIARGTRQQLVIKGLLDKISAPSTLQDPALLGKLFSFYQNTFADSLPIHDALATIRVLYPLRDAVALEPHAISIYPDDEKGVLFHPTTSSYNGLWVYEILNPTSFIEEVHTALLGKASE